MRTISRVLLAAVLAASFLSVVTESYVLSGTKWPSGSATFFINPQNTDVSVNAAESAVRYGMNVWNGAGANFAFTYGGRVTDTTVQNDHRNVVLFRDTADGSALATTYTWWTGGTLVDSDIVFLTAPFQFLTGTGPCSGGVFVEDVATHEFGHALGLLHSAVADSTMYPSYSFCSQEMRTLAADDISGVRSLYGTNPNANARPVVTITAPADGASVSGTIVFSGSASDTQDGNLSTSLLWTSSLDGTIGAGASFSKTLSPGTHVITASVSDSGGLVGSATESITVALTSPPTVGTNVALASAGAVASASSTYGSGYLPATLIDGKRAGAPWGAGGGWADGTPGTFPDWIEVDFPTGYAISQVNVFSVQNNFLAPVEPTATQTFTLYGLRDFQVQYWTGSAWAPVPGATITGNTLVWRAVTFTPVTTQKIRVLITGAVDGFSRLTELEAYTDTPTPPPPPSGGTNVALASAGAVASASSTYGSGYLPATAIDGRRPGTSWGATGGWADGTPGTFPDWIEVDFPTGYAISQVNVFSVQDNFLAPVEPTATQTFTLYGLRDFQVQYWTGSAWAPVPGATITGNTLVWRAVTFTPVTTQKIRVLITGAVDGFSRLTELEAYTDTPTPPPPPSGGTNVALASAGAVASASSTYGSGYLPATAIDGRRPGTSWGATGGWADGTPGTFPDWIEVDFPTAYAISRVNVFSVQDNFLAPVEPTATQTFTLYGLRDFQVQYWTGSAWAPVPGATITGNTLVWRAVTFTPVTTQKIRVLITGAVDGFSRVTELEAYTDTPTPPPPPSGGTNVALASAGAVASASSTYGSGYLPATAIDGRRPGTSWGATGGWADGTPGTFPDWIEVDFPTAYAISRVNVFSVQDNFLAPVEPTATQTFTLYGLRDFQVQYWTGSAWAPVPGATITGNTLVWRAVTFTPVTTQKIRVLITGAVDGFSRLTELEAYTDTPNADSDSLNNRVLVVYNGVVPDSLAVADYYMQKRAIPAANKCAIYTDSLEWFTTLDEYIAVERDPVRACLDAVGREKILYIVFSYGTPFKMSGASADQLVAAIWEQQLPVSDEGFTLNPYYALSASRDNSYPPGISFAEFRRSGPLIYSVWRLDAPTPALAKGLVDQALQVEGSGGLNGRGCFDSRYGDITIFNDESYLAGDWDIYRAAEMFGHAGFAVVHDTNDVEFGTPPAPLRCDGAAFYIGWYSLANYNDVFSWNPGAIGWHLDSASAYTTRTANNWAGGALGRGIAVTTGAVEEPYLEGLPHADGALRNLLEGLNVGDAIFRNTLFIRWVIINIGDPLYRPFPGGRPLP